MFWLGFWLGVATIHLFYAAIFMAWYLRITREDGQFHDVMKERFQNGPDAIRRASKASGN